MYDEANLPEVESLRSFIHSTSGQDLVRRYALDNDVSIQVLQLGTAAWEEIYIDEF